MNEFFTWAALGTYAGATLCVGLITQFFKGVGFIDRLPTRVFSYIVAAVVLVAANLFAGSLTPDTGVLCLINAFVVSLAANGAYDAYDAAKGNDTKIN